MHLSPVLEPLSLALNLYKSRETSRTMSDSSSDESQEPMGPMVLNRRIRHPEWQLRQANRLIARIGTCAGIASNGELQTVFWRIVDFFLYISVESLFWSKRLRNPSHEFETEEQFDIEVEEFFYLSGDSHLQVIKNKSLEALDPSLRPYYHPFHPVTGEHRPLKSFCGTLHDLKAFLDKYCGIPLRGFKLYFQCKCKGSSFEPSSIPSSADILENLDEQNMEDLESIIGHDTLLEGTKGEIALPILAYLQTSEASDRKVSRLVRATHSSCVDFRLLNVDGSIKHTLKALAERKRIDTLHFLGPPAFFEVTPVE